MGNIIINQNSLPMDINMEKKLLQQIFTKNEILPEIIAKIESQDFSDARNQLIFSAIKFLYQSDANVDVITVMNILKKDMPDIGMKYMQELSYKESIKGFKYNTKVIKELSLKRKAIIKMEKCLKNMMDTNTQYADVVADVNDIVNNMLIANSSGDKSKDIYTVAAESEREIMDNALNGKAIKGMETGIKDLDVALNGIEREKLHVIGARPAIGKTTLLINMMEGLAKRGYKSYFCSMEQKDTELINKILSKDTGIKNAKINNSKDMNQEDFAKLNEVVESYKGIPLRVNDNASLKLQEIEAIVLRETQKRGLDVFAIDYLQIMDREKGKGETDTVAIGRIVRGLQKIAKKYKIAIILLSQLKRPEKEGDRPTLTHLRESGDIEQCGDKIMLLHQDAEHEGVLEVIIAKNKSNTIGTVNLNFDKSMQSVSSRIRNDNEFTKEEKEKMEVIIKERKERLEEEEKQRIEKIKKEESLYNIEDANSNDDVDDDFKLSSLMQENIDDDEFTEEEMEYFKKELYGENYKKNIK